MDHRLSPTEARCQVISRTIDLRRDLLSGIEDRDASRDRVHEDLCPAVVVDILQCLQQWSEVEFSAAGKLKKFFFLREFLHAAVTVLPAIEHFDAVAECPNEVGQHLLVLIQMIGCQGDAQMVVVTQFNQPFQRIR